MAAEHAATLERVVDHGPSTRSLFLRPAVPPAFLPGQFVSLLLPLDGGVRIRPYSIASAPEAPEVLELVVDRVAGGLGSHYLWSLAAGAALRYTGPWGTFTLEEAPQTAVVFIAVGTGVAAIRPMVHRARATAVRSVTLLHACGPGDPSLFASELAAPHPGYAFRAVATDDLVATVERDYVAAADRSQQFFVCGVGDIVHRLRDLLRGAGWERRAVRYEKW